MFAFFPTLSSMLNHAELCVQKVDDTSAAVHALQVTLDTPYELFCSVRIVGGTRHVLAHECAAQQLLALSADGGRVLWYVDLGGTFQPTTITPQQSMLLLEEEVVLVGASTRVASCASIVTIHLLTQAQTELSIPCVAYNARVNGNVQRVYSMQGMRPQQVLRGLCLADMAVSQCYIVSMARSDLSTAQVYVPCDGGQDLVYVVSTDAMLAALGQPFVRESRDGGMTYTGTGNCMVAQDQTTLPGRAAQRPPSSSFGAGCPFRSLGWDCAQPLNLAFSTEITGSSQLLPAGFSVKHTHQDLKDIFEHAQASLQNSSGALMYQSMLRSAWNNATPVDWVELPVSRDIVYITTTTVGYLSTSGTVLLDPFAAGYCRAHDMLGCAPGSYGSAAEGTCRPCDDVGDGSVAYQVHCAYGAVQGRPPYAHFEYVADDLLQHEELEHALCLYKQMRGVPDLGDCLASDNSSVLSPPQPVTMAAEGSEAGWVKDVQEAKGTLQAATGVQNVYEWNSEDTSLLKALYHSHSEPKNDSHPLAYACGLWMGNGFLHQWLPCALKYLRSSTSVDGRRRLLSTTGEDDFGAQRGSDGATVVSTTMVTRQPRVQTRPLVVNSEGSSSANAGGSMMPAWEIGVIAGSCLLVVMVLFFLFRYSTPKRR